MIVCSNVIYVQSQVGIKTDNTKGALHIDGLGNNPKTGSIPKDKTGDDLVINQSLNSSNIGIGVIPDADSSAQLKLGGANSAFLPNRVKLRSANDIETVPNPEDGMVVYNTTDNATMKSGLYSYYNNQWNKLLEKEFISVIEYRDLWAGVTTSTGTGYVDPVTDTKAYENPSKSTALLWANPATKEKALQYITLPETGSFALSFRLYMKQSANSNTRAVGYLWAMKGASTAVKDVLDVSEINLTSFEESEANRIMTASVTLTVSGNKDDQVCIRWGAPEMARGSLRAAPFQMIPQKTSLIFWKL